MTMKRMGMCTTLLTEEPWGCLGITCFNSS